MGFHSWTAGRSGSFLISTQLLLLRWGFLLFLFTFIYSLPMHAMGISVSQLLWAISRWGFFPTAVIYKIMTALSFSPGSAYMYYPDNLPFATIIPRLCLPRRITTSNSRGTVNSKGARGLELLPRWIVNTTWIPEMNHGWGCLFSGNNPAFSSWNGTRDLFRNKIYDISFNFGPFDIGWTEAFRKPGEGNG